MAVSKTYCTNSRTSSSIVPVSGNKKAFHAASRTAQASLTYLIIIEEMGKVELAYRCYLATLLVMWLLYRSYRFDFCCVFIWCKIVSSCCRSVFLRKLWVLLQRCGYERPQCSPPIHRRLRGCTILLPICHSSITHSH